MTTIQEHRARLKFFPVDGGNLAYVDEGPVSYTHLSAGRWWRR